MAKVENRVELAIRRINDGLEKMRVALAGTQDLDRIIAHEKARHLDAVILKYLYTKDLDERISRRILQRSRNQLMKQANPGFLNRVFPEIGSTVSSVIDFFRDKKQAQKQLLQQAQETKALADHHTELIKDVAKKGFPEVANDITAGIKRGEESFRVKWSVYKQENEKVDYDLQFRRDQQGKYHFEWCEAHLIDKNRKTDQRLTIQIGTGHSFDGNQIYNLLCGRAVQLGDLKYILDLHDVGANGSHALRPSTAVREKFINTFADLPFMQNRDPDFVEEVASLLLNGDRLPFTYTDQQEQTIEFLLEANSQHTGVNYFDRNSVKTPFEKLFPPVSNTGMDLKIPNPQLTMQKPVEEQSKPIQEIQQDQRISPPVIPDSNFAGMYSANEDLSPAYLEHAPEIIVTNDAIVASIASQEAVRSTAMNNTTTAAILVPSASNIPLVKPARNTIPAFQQQDAFINTSGRESYRVYPLGEQITPGGIILPDNQLSPDQIARNALKYGKEPIRDFFERKLHASEVNNNKQEQQRRSSNSLGR